MPLDIIPDDAQIRSSVRSATRAFEDAFAARFALAVERGELERKSSPKLLAQLATSLVHTLAVRARSGDKAPALRALVASFIETIRRAYART